VEAAAVVLQLTYFEVNLSMRVSLFICLVIKQEAQLRQR